MISILNRIYDQYRDNPHNFLPERQADILITAVGIAALGSLGSWVANKTKQFVNQADKLLPEKKLGRIQEIKDVVKAFWLVPADKKETVAKQSARLFTKNMTGKERAAIIRILSDIQEDYIETAASKILGRVLNHLPEEGRTIEETIVSSTMEIADNLFQQPPILEGTIQELLAFADQMISESMNDKIKRVIYQNVAKWADTEHIQPFRKAPNLHSNPPCYAPNPPLSDLPDDLRWRLGIDLEHHPEGPGFFDTDESPGYQQGMENGFRLIDAIRDYRMNSRLLEMLHDVCIDGVENKGRKLQKGYASDLWKYSIDLRDIFPPTKDQLMLEWEKELLITVESNRPIFLARMRESFPYSDIISQFEGSRAKINAQFERFYLEAGAPGATMDEKYAALARCCRALQILHPFPDANGRTICFALCTLLLHQIGSPPAILSRPEVFDGTLTTSQMVEQIKEGVERYQRTKIEVLIEEYDPAIPSS